MSRKLTLKVESYLQTTKNRLSNAHALFFAFIPLTTFLYLVCGGINTLFEAILYFLLYNFLFKGLFFDLGLIVLSPHISTFLVVFPIVFSSGFFLTKFIVFYKSDLGGKRQLYRFTITILTSLLLQYLFMKIFVELFNIYPTPSKILTSGIVAILTYLLHRNYSFRYKEA